MGRYIHYIYTQGFGRDVFFFFHLRLPFFFFFWFLSSILVTVTCLSVCDCRFGLRGWLISLVLRVRLYLLLRYCA